MTATATIASANSTRVLCLPRRVFHDVTWADLEQELGVRVLGAESFTDDERSRGLESHYVKVETPSGFRLVGSFGHEGLSGRPTSPYQSWLVNSDGLAVAFVFYKDMAYSADLELIPAGSRFGVPATIGA